jgi:uncharacterized RmlC-like cupin family protein
MFRALALSASVLAFPLLAQRNVPVDNDQVRVVVVNDTSTAKGRLHEHATNRVMVYLDRGHQRLDYADGRAVDLRFNPGDALWSASGGMHTSQNIGGTPYRVVEVELKNKGGGFQYTVLDPIKVSPGIYKVVLDNPQVRVVRARVGARAAVPMHEHALNRLVVFLTDAHIRAISKDGTSGETKVKAGEVRWSGPAIHREQNLSDEPFEVLSVDVKP